MSGPIRSKKVLASAQGQPCTLRFLDVCNGDPATTIPAHVRDRFKGMGTKASDLSMVYACSDCHRYLDEGVGRWGASAHLKIEVLEAVVRGLQETLHSMVERDVIIAPQDRVALSKGRPTAPRKPKAERKKIPTRSGRQPVAGGALDGAVIWAAYSCRGARHSRPFSQVFEGPSVAACEQLARDAGWRQVRGSLQQTFICPNCSMAVT
jgi:hypothetical protein